MNLVINSKFSPFTYQEMLAPVAASTEAHKEVESNYGALQNEAAKLESLLSQTRDKESYAMYSGYLDQVRQAADALAVGGLDVGSRQNVMNLQKKYTTDITPVMLAAAKRDEQIKLQRDLAHKGGNMFFNKNMNDISVDDYLRGNNVEFKNIAGDELLKSSQNIASALAKEFQAGKFKLDGTGQFFEAMRKNGASSSEVMAAFKGQGKYAPILQKYREQILNARGVRTDGYSDSDIAEMSKFIDEGLWQAIGGGSVDTRDNQDYGRAASGAGALAPARPINITPQEDAVVTKGNAVVDKFNKIIDSKQTSQFKYDSGRWITEMNKTGKYVPVWDFVNSIPSGGGGKSSIEKSITNDLKEMGFANGIEDFRYAAKKYGLGKNSTVSDFKNFLQTYNTIKANTHIKAGLVGSQSANEGFDNNLLATTSSDNPKSNSGWKDKDGEDIKDGDISEKIKEGVSHRVFNPQDLSIEITSGGETYKKSLDGANFGKIKGAVTDVFKRMYGTTNIKGWYAEVNKRIEDAVLKYGVNSPQAQELINAKAVATSNIAEFAFGFTTEVTAGVPNTYEYNNKGVTN